MLHRQQLQALPHLHASAAHLPPVQHHRHVLSRRDRAQGQQVGVDLHCCRPYAPLAVHVLAAPPLAPAGAGLGHRSTTSECGSKLQQQQQVVLVVPVVVVVVVVMGRQASRHALACHDRVVRREERRRSS